MIISGRQGPATNCAIAAGAVSTKNKKSMVLCLRCGIRGTHAEAGYCNSVALGCRWKAHYLSAVQREKCNEKDAFIAHLIETWVIGGTEKTDADALVQLLSGVVRSEVCPRENPPAP